MNHITTPLLSNISTAKLSWDPLFRVFINSGDDNMSHVAISNHGFVLHAHRFFKRESDEYGSCAMYLANYGYLGSITRKYGYIVYTDIPNNLKTPVGNCDGQDSYVSRTPVYQLFPEPPIGYELRLRSLTAKQLKTPRNPNPLENPKLREYLLQYPFPARPEHYTGHVQTRNGTYNYDYHNYTDKRYYPGFWISFKQNGGNGYSDLFADVSVELEIVKSGGGVTQSNLVLNLLFHLFLLKALLQSPVDPCEFDKPINNVSFVSYNKETV